EYMDVSQVTGLDPARVALVLADIQNDFCRGQAANTATAERAQRFAAEAMMLGVHVVYTRQVLEWGQLTPRQQHRESPDGLSAAGSTGAELFLEALPGAAVVTKGRFDLWRSDQWWQYLSDQHIDGLIISGVELRCCVMYTVLGADEHGYAYTVPLDLVSGIDAGESTYNEWTRRYLRDVHDAPESSQELLSVWRGR
ncbi:MAG: cysteine hydrolase family protein, partial [Nocardioidaceae bacterium]